MELSPSRLFLPEQLSAVMRSAQRERFFGTGRDWRAAILTPIVEIYNALPDGRPLAGGWWPSKQWHDVLICATPQASAILDPVCALEPTTSVLFLGLAGALSDYAVGDVVEPSSVLLDGVEYPTSWTPSKRYPDARAVTVRCLNESLQRREELVGQAQVVDMEAGWVCAAAHMHGRPVRVVLVVSDEVHRRTFVENELTDIKVPISETAAEIMGQITETQR